MPRGKTNAAKVVKGNPVTQVVREMKRTHVRLKNEVVRLEQQISNSQSSLKEKFEQLNSLERLLNNFENVQTKKEAKEANVAQRAKSTGKVKVVAQTVVKAPRKAKATEVAPAVAPVVAKETKVVKKAKVASFKMSKKEAKQYKQKTIVGSILSVLAVRPMHYKEILYVLRQMGFAMEGKQPEASMVALLSRDERFERTGRGVYGLKVEQTA